MRDGKPIELQVTIGEQPADFGKVAQAVPDENPLSSFGLVLQDLTPDLAEQLGYKGRQGLVISEVTPGSPAAVVGLKSGLLIEEVQKVPVKNLEELKLIMQQSQTKDRVLLRIRMGQNSRYIVLKKN